MLITSQHAVHQITQRSPKVFTAIGQSMLIDEQYVVLEAGIEMRLQTQLDDDGVVVAVDVGVDTVEALEHVPNERGK